MNMQSESEKVKKGSQRSMYVECNQVMTLSFFFFCFKYIHEVCVYVC